MISIQEFNALYQNHKDMKEGFCKLFVSSKRSNSVGNISYYSFSYWNGKEYMPLILNISRSTLHGGVRQNLDFVDSSPYICFRKSSCELSTNNNFGEILILINELYMNAVKSAIKNGDIDDLKVLNFVQSVDKHGNAFDDDIIRIKLRKNQSSYYTFPITQVLNKKKVHMDDLNDIRKGADVWLCINFSYIIKSNTGYSNSSCVKELVFRNRMHQSTLLNDDELDGLSDNE